MKSKFHTIFKVIFIILVFTSLFTALLWSILNNSLNYQINVNDKEIIISMLGQKMALQNNGSKEALSINLNPQNRFTTRQYLIQDQGFVLNSIQLINYFLLRKNPSIIKYSHPINFSINYVHVNPYRASLHLSRGSINNRVEVNVPDSTLELWREDSKLNNFTVKPPWPRLIFFPLLSSLLMATIIFYCITLLKAKQKLNFLQVVRKQNEKKDRLINNHSLIIPFIIFIAGLLLIGFIFLQVFKAMPGFGDEMNYLIQAKIFASGKLYVKEPPMPEFFRVDWMDIFGSDGKLWNFHAPGNSVILALGWLVGKKWITVPLVGGLILLVQYLIPLHLFDNHKIAILNVIVVATSHYFLSLASSFMAHAPSLLFVSLFYLFVIKLLRTGKQRNLTPASLCIGMAFIIRPLSAVLSMIIPLPIVLFFLIKQKKINYSYVFLSLFFGIVVASTIFLYTYKITGHWNFSYFIKGPEVGLTLSARWAKDLNFKLSNLYRNSNEFQNRVHSFGQIANYVFFLLPLFFLKNNRYKWWIIASYFSFLTYLIIHSLLHWYGWKWESRMMYEISFIFFLLTTYGIWLFYKNIKNNKFLKPAAILVGVCSFVWVAISNLPYRFEKEYKNYNFAPIGVREIIHEKNISNALIFFANQYLFAPYSPENSLSFDGSIVYAISQDENYDYRLITKFPDKRVYYSPDAETLIEKANFYRKDIYQLGEDLTTNYRDYEIVVVIPWLDISNTKLNDSLPGRKFDENQFLEFFKEGLASKNTKTMIVLIDQSTELVKIIKHFYLNPMMPTVSDYETQIKYLIIDPNSRIIPPYFPGIEMTCYEGTSWKGRIIKQQVVTSISAAQCYGNNRSVIWETNLTLPKSKRINFYLKSDDGSALYVNGRVVIDNKLSTTHGFERKTGIANFEEGENKLKIIYFNGPGPGSIEIGKIDQQGKEKKILLDSFESLLYLTEKDYKS